MSNELFIISIILNVILVFVLLLIWCWWIPKKEKTGSSKCKSCGISAKFSSGYCLGCEPDDDDEEF